MKNIIIGGSPRSGKSTLANILKKEFPSYNVLHCDVIRNTFSVFVDETHLKDIVHNDVLYRELMIRYINENINANDYPYIVEWSRLYPTLMNNIIGDNICIALSLGSVSAQDIFEMCRKYDSDVDYTFYENDTKLFEQCKRWEKVNQRIVDEKEYADIYMNTYNSRLDSLYNVVEKLKSII